MLLGAVLEIGGGAYVLQRIRAVALSVREPSLCYTNLDLHLFGHHVLLKLRAGSWRNRRDPEGWRRAVELPAEDLPLVSLSRASTAAAREEEHRGASKLLMRSSHEPALCGAGGSLLRGRRRIVCRVMRAEHRT
jgi:hypothetical protein